MWAAIHLQKAKRVMRTLQRSSVKTEVTLKATDFTGWQQWRGTVERRHDLKMCHAPVAGNSQTTLPDKTVDINLI